MTRSWPLILLLAFGFITAVDEQCRHPRCRKAGDIYLGQGDDGQDGYVCEKHLQYCSITEQGTWRLWHRLRDARKAQAEEKWE